MTDHIKKLAEDIFGAVKAYCASGFDAVNQRLKTLEERQPVDGKDGKDGADGKSVELDVVVREVLGQIEKPKDGENGQDGKDGTSVDPEAVHEMVKAAVAEIPKAADGKDADAEAIAQQVLREVSTVLDAIPVPTNGKDGADGKDGLDGKDVDPDALRTLVRDAVAELPTPKDGAPGKDGENGRDGQDGAGIDPEATAETLREMVREAVAALPPVKDGAAGADGRDGVDGKDADPEQIAAAVTEAVKALPAPKDGRDGQDVQPDQVREMILAAATTLVAEMLPAAVAKAVEALPKPRDGADADPEVIRQEVQKAVDALDKPKDGRDGRDGIDGKAGRGIDGKDGEDGRDAIDLEILENVELWRSYPRRTFANFRGGVIRSFRTTDPVVDSLEAAGWAVHTEGEAGFEVVQTDDRTFSLKRTMTSGKVYATEVKLPVQIYRGVHVEDKTYERGDTATWAGSLWHCNAAGTTEKPGTGGDWTLAAKKGRDGKDATAQVRR